MRQIKFRGKRLDGFGYSYGDVSHDGKRTYVGGYLVGEVAQLVGHDKHGREVYEGDTVRAVYDGEVYDYVAKLTGCAITDKGYYIYAYKFNEHELI